MIRTTPTMEAGRELMPRGIFPEDAKADGRVIIEERPVPWDMRAWRWTGRQIATPRRLVRLALWAFRKAMDWYAMARLFIPAEFGPRIEEDLHAERMVICHGCEFIHRERGRAVPWLVTGWAVALAMAIIWLAWSAWAMALALPILGLSLVPIGEHGFCSSCGCPPWTLSRLKHKNRLLRWRCPRQRHPGTYPQYARIPCGGNGRAGTADGD